MKHLSTATLAIILGVLCSPNVANAYTTYTGTLTLNITASVVSNISTSTDISCTFNASVSGPSDNAEEDDTVTATRSGSTATCTLVIPYSWHLYDAAHDSVGLSYTISGFGNTNGRSTSNGIGSIPIPANGANHSYSVSGVRL